MDNRLNVLRRKIRALRLEMLDLQASIRDQIKREQDCAESSARLMDMRRELTVLVQEWTRLGGGDRLPTIEERLRENYRPVARPKPVAEFIARKRGNAASRQRAVVARRPGAIRRRAFL